MKMGARWWALLALSVGCGSALALLAVEGSVTIDPSPAMLLRGQTATITYTVTNIGDEAWDAAAVGVEYFESGPTSSVLPVPTAATPPCVSQFVDFPSPIPGAPTYVVNTNTLYPRPILPGESRQCVMDLVVSPDAAGPFVQLFSLTGSLNGQIAYTSQEVAFNLGQGAVAVPALMWPSLVVLVLLVSWLGARLLWR